MADVFNSGNSQLRIGTENYQTHTLYVGRYEQVPNYFEEIVIWLKAQRFLSYDVKEMYYAIRNMYKKKFI